MTGRVTGHYLNSGLVEWFLGLPGLMGNQQWTGIYRGLPGAWHATSSGTNGPTPSARKGGRLDGQFDGSTNYLRLNASGASLYDLAGNFTVAVWCMPVSVSGSMAIVEKYTSGTNANYGLFVDSTSSYKWHVYLSAGSNVNFLSTAAAEPVAGTWQHIAQVYDGAHCYLYVNGVQNASSAVTGSPVISEQAVSIGSSAGLGTYWNGRIDDIRFWNRALSANEMAAVYTDSLRGYPLTLRRPDRRWRLGFSGGGSVTVNVGAVHAVGYIGNDGISLITGPLAVAATAFSGLGGMTLGVNPAAVLATGYAGGSSETLTMGAAGVLATGYAGGSGTTLAAGSAAVAATAYAGAAGVSVIIAAPAPLATGYVGSTGVVLGGTVVVSAGAVSASGVAGVAGVTLILGSTAVHGAGYAGASTAGPSPGAAAVSATWFAGGSGATLATGGAAVAATGYAGGISVTLGGMVVVSAGAVSAGGIAGVAGVSLIFGMPAVHAVGYAGGTTAGPSPAAVAVSASGAVGATAETIAIGVLAPHVTGYASVITIGLSGVTAFPDPFRSSSATQTADSFASTSIIAGPDPFDSPGGYLND